MSEAPVILLSDVGFVQASYLQPIRHNLHMMEDSRPHSEQHLFYFGPCYVIVLWLYAQTNVACFLARCIHVLLGIPELSFLASLSYVAPKSNLGEKQKRAPMP